VVGEWYSAAVPSPRDLELVSNAERWELLVQESKGHLLQTWAWGELKCRFGWRAERLALPHGQDGPAAAQVLYRQIAPGLRLAYVPRGPLVQDPTRASALLVLLAAHVRARGCFLLKIEPDWARGDPRDAALAGAGSGTHTQFAPSAEAVQPSTTIQIDLTADEQAILGRMKPKWRYNIRLSEKKGIHVRAGTGSDLSTFYELMQATGRRDRFAIHTRDYYDVAFELLSAAHPVRLLVAEYDGQALGMIFVAASGDEAIYLYGASANAERNRMPNHALHWAAILWAKQRGCRHYDLWGIPEAAGAADAESNLPDTLYQFKQGFGGRIVRYSGAWDLVVNPTKFNLYRLARRIRARSMA
jgi:lipid II:glycine glycyltransferase (peptidoglycan interpeptide bridge formation enzyme)